VAATNRKLNERIQSGKFREDLYYRLATVGIELPSLRERPDDVYLLFRYFANNFAERQGFDPIQIDDEARWLLEQYRWPGNIRELKNVTEQLSILAEKRDLTAVDLLTMMPKLRERNLPVASREASAPDGLQEREILYKVLFDMKSDLNDLKGLIFELIRSNDLRVPDMGKVRSLQLPATYPAAAEAVDRMAGDGRPVFRGENSDEPILVDSDMQREYDRSEIVDEDLSLAKAERELIRKALKKHQGRRKDASSELGISERTLYRKIKEYELPT
jgi:DNA-binding NtrC family response regulator